MRYKERKKTEKQQSEKAASFLLINGPPAEMIMGKHFATRACITITDETKKKIHRQPCYLNSNHPTLEITAISKLKRLFMIFYSTVRVILGIKKGFIFAMKAFLTK